MAPLLVASIMAMISSQGGLTQPAGGAVDSHSAGAPSAVQSSSVPREHFVGHIVEEPGGIEHMTECDAPTEEYYDRLNEYMVKRHPQASKFVLEHSASLEVFLDMSIIAGFSFGVEKSANHSV